MTHSNPADAEVLSRAKSGDAQAFAVLLRDHRESLFAYFARSTGDTDQAADLLQLTLIRAWQGLATYQDRGRLRAWLFTLARRVLIDEKRREDRRPTVAIATTVPASESVDPLSELVAGELELAILAAVAGLPEVRRDVFLMRHHSSMTFREIAHALEIPIGTALSHMHHALRSLKAVLERHDVKTS